MLILLFSFLTLISSAADDAEKDISMCTTKQAEEILERIRPGDLRSNVEAFLKSADMPYRNEKAGDISGLGIDVAPEAQRDTLLVDIPLSSSNSVVKVEELISIRFKDGKVLEIECNVVRTGP